MREQETIPYDIAIMGAGPAGCTAALALKDAGLKVALIDKNSFPRDKVCGDAIPGRAIRTLSSIDPAFEQAFLQFPHKEQTKHTTLYYNGEALTFNWVKPYYTCRRIDFDALLYRLVKENTGTHIYPGVQPGKAEVMPEAIGIPLDGKIIKAKLLIGADGAQSATAKQLTGKVLDRQHHAASVRAYYHNVAGCDGNNMEVWFDKAFLPSYLWIFPLPGNCANVGFGMLSSEISRRKVNIKQTFYEFLARVPELTLKFKDAAAISPLDGFSLPLGNKTGCVSGKRFMLAGDAASLVDPISGEGIGNAMMSGKLAAAQAIRCFSKQDFSAECIKQYDRELTASLGKELRLHYKAQRLLSAMPLLLDGVLLAGKHKFLSALMQKCM